MSEGLTVVDWVLCALAVSLALFAMYTHVEGNRVSATRFVFHDIRREMKSRPAYVVWWRAFKIAMGWRKHSSYTSSHSRHRDNVTPISKIRLR